MEPRNCPGFTYRNSILVGTTDMTAHEFRTFIENCADDYNGDTYHLIVKNCNHFSNDVCCRLTGKDVPSWVNRLARIGMYLTHSLFNNSHQRYLFRNRSRFAMLCFPFSTPCHQLIVILVCLSGDLWKPFVWCLKRTFVAFAA